MQPTGQIIREAIGHIAKIVEYEYRLAAVELRNEVLSEVVKPSIWLAVGGMLGMVAGAFLLLGLAYGLHLILPIWIATLLVGVFSSLIGVVLMALGWNEARQAQKGIHV